MASNGTSKGLLARRGKTPEVEAVGAPTGSDLARVAELFAPIPLSADQARQFALIEGSDVPEIYRWLGDALLRKNDLGEARNILQEAVEKWPADARFAKPLAILYATFGQGREAVRTLARHLEHDPADIEALALGVEWMYHLHLSNATAYSRAEDLKRARGYADRYAGTKGLQQALVRQWMEYLEKR